MTHSKMLETRRRKKKGLKILARMAKLEKKLAKQKAKAAGAPASKPAAP
jgi:BMFP domain-containing protein YqiC